MIQDIQTDLDRAANAILNADAIMIGAGAGMGVDSGLPDFRGNEGFWKAYPMAKKLGLSFSEMANPALFLQAPRQAWGFYGHRMNLYRDTDPHKGYTILKKWMDIPTMGGFVYTSNVDGHFQKAGFPIGCVFECHGSIHHLQCSQGCSDHIWSADEYLIEVYQKELKVVHRLPLCDQCGQVVRPNILMFNDYHWIPNRSAKQEDLWYDWLQTARRHNLVVIEIGAGTAIPTVRKACERAGGTLIRINPNEFDVLGQGVSIPLGALDAISELDRRLQSRRS